MQCFFERPRWLLLSTPRIPERCPHLLMLTACQRGQRLGSSTETEGASLPDGRHHAHRKGTKRESLEPHPQYGKVRAPPGALTRCYCVSEKALLITAIGVRILFPFHFCYCIAFYFSFLSFYYENIQTYRKVEIIVPYHLDFTILTCL